MAAVGKILGEVGQNIASGLGRKFDDKILQHGRDLLLGKGITTVNVKVGTKGKKTVATAVADLNAEQVVKALKSNGIKVTLDQTKFDELFPELSMFGYVPIPGYDYAGNTNQLFKLVNDPQTGTAARRAISQNYSATDDLYTHPQSPIFKRIVGDESDPLVRSKLIADERARNERFYEDITEDTQTNYGPLDPITAVGMQSPLSKGSGPAAEMLSYSAMVENPEQMLSIPSNLPQNLRAVYGGSGTTYGAPSIIEALAQGLKGPSWIDDPTSLSAQGGLFKIGSYALNKLRAGTEFGLPGAARRVGRKQVRDLVSAVPVTNDRQAIVAALGGFRPLGEVATLNQDVYNLFSDLMREQAAARGITGDKFQARIWYPIRELLNKEVGGAAPVGRLIQPSQEAIDAFGKGATDPRGIVQAAERASKLRLEEDLSVATTAAEKKFAKSKFKERNTQLAKIRKSDPRLMALAALMGGGAAGIGLSGGGDDRSNLDALGRMS